MKKLLFTVIAACSITVSGAQAPEAVSATPAGGTSVGAKKPTIMVIPSNQYCNEHGFVKEYDNNGEMVKYPDYARIMMEDTELALAISKVGELMSERGFNLKLLSSCLNTLANDAAEEALMMSKNTGAMAAETPYEKLKKTAKADIILHLYWKASTFGSRKTITYNIQGVDSYTDKQIAASSGTSMPSSNPSVAALVSEQVAVHMEQFASQLQEYFNNLFDQGREISITCLRFEDAEVDYESEFNGFELGELIEEYLAQNTVGGRFNTTDATENRLYFEQVRIPMVMVTASGRERAVDARYFARGLAKKITEITGAECKVTTRGLGQASIWLGGK